jgi:hypothetical protein
LVNDCNAISLGNRVHLAPLNTRSTSLTSVTINDGEVIGARYRILNAKFRDSPKDAATATAAITDVADPLPHIAYCVNQSDLLKLVQQSQRTFL